MRKRSVALFAFGAMVLAARPAHSEPAWMKVFVSPGLIASWSFSPDTASGAGFEISAGYIDIDSKIAPHFGGVFRTQGYNTGPWGSFGRHMIGLEGGVSIVGLEVGWAFRDEFPLVVATNGFHFMPYVSFGIVYFGPQFLIPVNTSTGVEFALNLGFKLPFPQVVMIPILLLGNWGRMPSGRPLRVDGVERSASLRSGRGWRHGRKPRTTGLDPGERARLASHWSDEARAEHASVATFAKLVLELLAVGAPASLVKRAQRAAADEIRHAEICFCFASAYAGAPIEPGPIDLEVRVRKPSLARMAKEAFVDGWIGEGLAAATLEATESADPVVRKALRTMARDERRHAMLGRAIVRWCTKRGGQPVKAALQSVGHGSALASGSAAGAG